MSYRTSSSAENKLRDTLRQLLDDVAQLKRLSASITPGGGLPSGALVAYGGAAAPSGWLLCDGSSLLRSAYPDLFAAIGTAYGAADGTHFNVPDTRGRVLAGKGTNANVNTLGQNEGAAVGNRQTRHFHPASGLGFSGSISTTGVENQGFNHNYQDTYWSESSGPSGYGAPHEGSPSGTDNDNGGYEFTRTTDTQNQNHTHNFTPAGSVTGNVGVTSAAAQDTPAYLVVNHIIKT